MGPSYFVTYGGDRLTFPGATGSVAWEYRHPLPKTDTVTELWKNTGTTFINPVPLSANVSAYDALLINYGQNLVQQTVLWPVSYSGVSSTIETVVGLTRNNATPYYMHRGMRLQIQNGSSITAVSSVAQSYNPYACIQNSFIVINGVSGVKYAK